MTRTYNKSIHVEIADISQTLRNMLAVSERARFSASLLDESQDVLDSLRAINGLLTAASILVDVQLLEIADRQDEVADTSGSTSSDVVAIPALAVENN